MNNSIGLCNIFGEIGKIWHQGHGGIIWEFMEQHKQGLLHKPQIIGISLLLEKRNIRFGYLVALVEVDHWNGIGKGWEPGALEHGKEICSSSSPTRCSRTKTAAKTRKIEKSKKLRKPGCHKPTPLRINLVLEIWLLREPSQTYRPSETCCFSDFPFLRHTVPMVASNIYEGVYFTRSTVLTECSLSIHHIL